MKCAAHEAFNRDVNIGGIARSETAAPSPRVPRADGAVRQLRRAARPTSAPSLPRRIGAAPRRARAAIGAPGQRARGSGCPLQPAPRREEQKERGGWGLGG